MSGFLCRPPGSPLHSTSDTPHTNSRLLLLQVPLIVLAPQPVATPEEPFFTQPPPFWQPIEVLKPEALEVPSAPPLPAEALRPGEHRAEWLVHSVGVGGPPLLLVRAGAHPLLWAWQLPVPAAAHVCVDRCWSCALFCLFGACDLQVIFAQSARAPPPALESHPAATQTLPSGHARSATRSTRQRSLWLCEWRGPPNCHIRLVQLHVRWCNAPLVLFDSQQRLKRPVGSGLHPWHVMPDQLHRVAELEDKLTESSGRELPPRER